MSHPCAAPTSELPRVWGRVGGVVALATSLVHIPMLGAHGWMVSVIVAAMLIGCAHCSLCLFRAPVTGAWLRTGAMGAVMLLVHPLLAAAMGHMPGAQAPWMTLMPILAGVEAALAMIALAVLVTRPGARVPNGS